MAFQTAAGYGNLPNGNFSPVIYSKQVQLAFRKSSTVESITNNEYFGEISNMGDTVRIIKEPEISVSSYARGTTITPQDLDDEDFTLVIDKANYYWSGVSNIYGKTVLRSLDHNQSKICNSNINLLKVIFGFMPYQKLPGLYVSGVISRKLINTIKQREKNTFFHETNPDVYSALAISSFVKKYLRIEKPLFLVGTSKKSVAYKLIMKKKNNFLIKYNDFIKKSEKDKIFISPRVNKYFWHSRLPSAFIFSALFNIPNTKYKNSKIYNFIFLCALGTDILHKDYFENKKEKILIKKLYNDTIKKSQIPYFLVFFFTILLFTIKKIHKKNLDLLLKIKFYFYKKASLERYIYSTDRSKLKNIFIASQLI